MDENNSILSKFYYTILELIFPEAGICFICEDYNEEIGESHICGECSLKLKFIGRKKCMLCGKPLDFIPTSGKCEDCISRPNYFTMAFSPLEYSGLIKDAIYKYKYGKKSYMYKSFGYLLLKAINENNVENIDIIVPVPLHRSKLIKRGFNQSEILGRYLSSSLKIKCDSKNLIRSKKTSIQNKLSRLERRKNIKNAFSVKKDEIFKDKKILLIDDILTTGSTANECSKVLLGAGAREVIVLTIATGKKI